MYSVGGGFSAGDVRAEWMVEYIARLLSQGRLSSQWSTLRSTATNGEFFKNSNRKYRFFFIERDWDGESFKQWNYIF